MSARSEVGTIRLATFVVCVSLTGWLAAPPRAAEAAAANRSSAEVVELLRQGKPVELEGTTIREQLDLRPLGVVKALFVCRDCDLLGGLVASNVVFEGPVDLGGTTVVGGVDLHGATFEAPALFGVPWADDTSLGGTLIFSLATFEDLASFDRVEFAHAVDFQLARFRSGSGFSEAVFEGAADFTRATFGKEARFDQAEFLASATFGRALFQGLADFRQGEFAAEANFARTRFAQGASFAGGRFSGEESELAVTFERAASDGRLDFGDSTFSNDAIFQNLTASAVSFHDVRIASRATFSTVDMSVDDFVLALEEIEHVTPDQEHRVLELVESSAKARGDLRLANEAHYRLQIVASRDDIWLQRIADRIFYRGVAGYLVRPAQPLGVLLALAFVVSVYRYERRRRSGAAASRARPLRARLGRWAPIALERVRGAMGEFLDTLSLIGPGKSDPDRRLEILCYRVLVVCVLLGLANSNPTLRQMVDALL